MKGIFLSLIFVVSYVTVPHYVFAYRPFVSTDAAVTKEGKWRYELGFFKISYDEDEIIAPSHRLIYGVLKNWELGHEFDVQVYKEGKGRDGELKNPVVYLKSVVREGILQNQQRVSFGGIFAVLLPSTVEGERDVGLRGSALISGRISNWVYHLNVGGELDRKDFDPNGIWGVILEYPFRGKFRMVGEVNGIVKSHGPSDNSGLIGSIWKIGTVDLDLGIRKGLSNTTPDWELTTGITFSF